MPTSAELSALSDLASDVENENGFETLGFNVNFLGYYNVAGNNAADTEKAFFWSDTEVDPDDNQAYVMVIIAQDESDVNTSNKANAFTIRCVKDNP